nr:DNA recombination protein RmuC [Rubrimonas cliftonensis]
MGAELAALWARLLAEPQLQIAAALAAMALVALWAALAARRAGLASAALSAEIAALAVAARGLGAGQQQLAGGLRHVSEAQGAAQARMAESMERRLEEVQRRMGDTLHGSASRTARALGELQTRLEAIDRAQTNIERLSGDVLGLQDILANKQARGAFGEIQLLDIVSKALPPDGWSAQATLADGRRVDCLIHAPWPPGPIAVDAKFPLEAYEALVAAEGEREKREAARAFAASVRKHVRDIAERYVVPGETADGALMFLPSEAVYAELHARHGEVVREGFALRVWIVSPTTLMATLTTLRAVMKDARMAAQAGAMRRELGLLHKDVERLMTRVGRLDTHFEQARRDVEEIRVSAEKAGARALRLEAADFGEQPQADAGVAAPRSHGANGAQSDAGGEASPANGAGAGAAPRPTPSGAPSAAPENAAPGA